MAHFCLGMEKGRLRDDAGAMAEFAEAVRLKPDLLVARLNLGIALFNQHRDDDATAQFQAVLRGDSPIRSPRNISVSCNNAKRRCRFNKKSGIVFN